MDTDGSNPDPNRNSANRIDTGQDRCAALAPPGVSCTLFGSEDETVRKRYSR